MKITNVLILIVLAGVFVALFTQFLNVGVNDYGLTVDSELQTTLDELNAATQNENITAVTSALDSGNTSVSDEGTGEILQYKKASSLVTTVQSVKPVSNTMFSSIAEYLNVPIFIKSAFGVLLSIGFLSFGVYLILRVKP
jgi:hypothetical protein